jgi:hypothetical protein
MSQEDHLKADLLVAPLFEVKSANPRRIFPSENEGFIAPPPDVDPTVTKMDGGCNSLVTTSQKNHTTTHAASAGFLKSKSYRRSGDVLEEVGLLHDIPSLPPY